MIFIWLAVVVFLWVIVIGLWLIVKINAARLDREFMPTDPEESPVRLVIEAAGVEAIVFLVVALAFAIAATVPLVVVGAIRLVSHFGWQETYVYGVSFGSAGIFAYLWWRKIRPPRIPSNADGAPRKRTAAKDLPGMDEPRRKG